MTGLKALYNLPSLEESFEQYFGSLAPDERPTDVRLRGPLLFGIAESERARLFMDVLESGDYNEAGQVTLQNI